jgi:hypothetical protein
MIIIKGTKSIFILFTSYIFTSLHLGSPPVKYSKTSYVTTALRESFCLMRHGTRGIHIVNRGAIVLPTVVARTAEGQEY